MARRAPGSPKPSLSSTAAVGIRNPPRSWPVSTKQLRERSPARPTMRMLIMSRPRFSDWPTASDAALATYDRAIALDRNHTAAYVGRARNLITISRAADAVAPVERGPRDPDLYVG